MRNVRWAYGVMTVPERKDDLLPLALGSLMQAGFPRPNLFVDGASSGYERLGLSVTYRSPKIGAWGNFILALYELYIREPLAERYAIFQDDILAVKNLRDYLDRCRYPDGSDGREPGFWNLVTMRGSEMDVIDRGTNCGWVQGALLSGEEPKQRLQKCAGALGLVFNRRAAGIILGAPSSIQKAISTDKPRSNIDGAVVTAMNLYRQDPLTGERWPHGWREYVHGPSLLTHTGEHSTIREGKTWGGGIVGTWKGEEWNPLEMLEPTEVSAS